MEPQKAICWEVGVGYLSGKASVIPLEGGTLVPDKDMFQDDVVQVCEKLVIFCIFWSCKLATVSPQTVTVHSS